MLSLATNANQAGLPVGHAATKLSPRRHLWQRLAKLGGTKAKGVFQRRVTTVSRSDAAKGAY